jgi:hypothetical protein
MSITEAVATMRRVDPFRLASAVISILVMLPIAAPVTADGSNDPRACEAWFGARAERAPAAFYSPRSNIGCFDGKLAPETTQELLSWLDGLSPHLSALSIRSGGGDVKSGLAIGKQILRTQTKVYARDLCASSCANYIFMVGRESEALPNTLILYHGGVSPKRIAEIPDGIRAALGTTSPLVNRETQRLTGELEQQLSDQRALYAAAGLQPSFLERFDLISWNLIPADQCTPNAVSKTSQFIFLTPRQYSAMGAHPAGDLLADIDRAHELLAATGRETVGLCVAPNVLFDPVK